MLPVPKLSKTATLNSVIINGSEEMDVATTISLQAYDALVDMKEEYIDLKETMDETKEQLVGITAEKQGLMAKHLKLQEKYKKMKDRVNNAKRELCVKNTNNAQMSLEDLIKKQKAATSELKRQVKWGINQQQHVIEQLQADKQELTTNLNRNDEFTLELRAKHDDEINKLQEKLSVLTEEKHKIALELESSNNEREKQTQSYTEKLNKMNNVIEQIQRNNRGSIFSNLSFDSKKISESNTWSFKWNSSALRSIWGVTNKSDRYTVNCYTKYILRQFYMTRLIVFGIGVWIFPSKMIGSMLLATSNCFHWMYAYKYGRKHDLIKESIVSSFYLILSKYIKNTKQIGIGITIHGLSDLLNLYQSMSNNNNKDNNQFTEIMKEIAISAALDILMGITTVILWKRKINETNLKMCDI